VLDEEKPLFEVEQAARYEGDVYESLIAEFIQYKERPTMEEIAIDGLGIEKSKITRPEQRRIGAAMKALGWERKRETNGARRWYYVPSPPPVVRPPESRRSAATDEDDAPL
jgi:predicted P-loop ATPase